VKKNILFLLSFLFYFSGFAQQYQHWEGQWEDNEKHTYFYDKNSNATVGYAQKWINNEWVNINSTLTIYYNNMQSSRSANANKFTTVFIKPTNVQPYHPLVQEGKVWSDVFVEGPIWNYQFTTAKTTLYGDTIINGVSYKKIYVSRKEYPKFPQDWVLKGFIREDENKRVWEKKNATTVETLLYDFSLQIGDTVPAEIGFQEFPPIIVENITYKTMNNGAERKVLHLSSLCYGSPNHKEFWIEGIGSSLGVLEPITGELIGGFTRLLCLHENEELIFNDNPWFGKCYLDNLGINAFDKQINIFPNPANNVIFIENTDNLDFYSISILNIQGQTVREYDVTSTQLDVSDITSGIYFIKFSTSRGEVVKKIIINR